MLSRLSAVVVAMSLTLPAIAAGVDEDMWPGIHKEVFDNRVIAEEDGTVALEAPVRADDAAVTPLTIRIPAAIAGDVKNLTLIVDKNPAPVVAKFTFGDAAGLGERVISTRVRVDMYSNIRAVIETGDGKLHMATKFVKAAGGCSAPALKDADQALANVGKMQVRSFPGAAITPAMREAQVMIRHPNYSGMQMNQLTGLYIPAKFVREMVVKRGDDLVFHMEGGISLSEDPNIRFTYAPSADDTLEVTATDTDNRVFTIQHAARGS